jgi:hypothetical protein
VLVVVAVAVAVGGAVKRPNQNNVIYIYNPKHDAVLMTLTGSYRHGLSSPGGEVSSFENYDVFLKELEMFVTYVTDSLWCYLRLHGLTVKVEENNRSSRKEESRK